MKITFEWDIETKKLIDHLINEVAGAALARNPPPIESLVTTFTGIASDDPRDREKANSELDHRLPTVNGRNTGAIMIESGREKLQAGSSIFRTLGRLDVRERESAYMALFRLILGAMQIVGATAMPIEAMEWLYKQYGDQRAAHARKTRAGEPLSKRDQIVKEAFEEEAAKNGGRLPKVLALSSVVNTKLKEAKMGSISDDALYRLRRKLGYSQPHSLKKIRSS